MSFLDWLRSFALLGLPVGLVLGLWIGWAIRAEADAGGYASFRRRALRLGHVAAVMLPLIGGFYALLWHAFGGRAEPEPWLGAAWALGGLALVVVLFLAAWRPALRVLLPLPALVLTAASALFALRLLP
jgi:hypothetical protein